jgi:hypothetical protein
MTPASASEGNNLNTCLGVTVGRRRQLEAEQTTGKPAAFASVLNATGHSVLPLPSVIDKQFQNFNDATGTLCGRTVFGSLRQRGMNFKYFSKRVQFLTMLSTVLDRSGRFNKEKCTVSC